MTRKQTTLFSLILGVIVASTLPATVLAQAITTRENRHRLGHRTVR